MSSAKIKEINYGANWITTGSGANMIKPSTGYAFYNMATDAQGISEAMVNHIPIVRKEFQFRFQFYDRLLLKILEENPEHGKNIFQNLFKRIPINNVLTFLSEKSSVRQEISIFLKLPLFIFLQVVVKDILVRLSKIAPNLLALLVTLISIMLSAFGLVKIMYVFLILGFLTVGLSHGAVDHLTDIRISGNKELLKFIISYLAKGAVLGVVWIWLPDIALVAFIVVSAWHFGQADFKEWNLKYGLRPLAWGLIVLLTMLFYHLQETIEVLETIDGLKICSILKGVTTNQIITSQILITFFSLLSIYFFKSKNMLVTIFYLLLSSMLPLLVSFGIYFVLQHSLHGWSHLKIALKTNTYNLWLKSLPFSISGAVIISTFMFFNSTQYFSLFFILLSCMSVPHIISMNHFYFRFNSIKN